MKNVMKILLTVVISLQMIFCINIIIDEKDKKLFNKSSEIYEMKKDKKKIEEEEKERIETISYAYKEMTEIKLEARDKKLTVLEEEYKKEQERKMREKILKEKSLRASRGGSLNTGSINSNCSRATKIVVTHYTSLAEENGGYAGISATGKPLSAGIVASGASIPFGTVFKSTYGTFIVEDRMHESYAHDSRGIRLDVFVPRNPGENDYQYKQRVNSLGIKVVDATIIRWGR